MPTTSPTWSANWITAPGPTAPLPIFRRLLTIKPGLARAVAHITGLGHYELFCNGEKVGNDLLSPGWTNYRKTCLYDSLDLTPLLKPGNNAIGVMLGNGFYNVEKTDRYTKFTGSIGPPKFIAQIELTYADGSRETIVSDANWRTTPGPITYSHIFGGEDHDRRRLPNGWAAANFDDAAWQPAVESPGPRGELRGPEFAAPPIRAIETFKPVATRKISDSVDIYDLGQNASMIPRIIATGPAGSIVRITPSELVHPDGSLDRQSCAPGTKATTYWQLTLAGEGDETWMSQFSYQGCRYLAVERIAAAGSNDLPTMKSLEGVVVHSSAKSVGEFSCSNELFNRTRTLIRWAQRSNLMSVITDCPHRERLGWLEQYHLHGPSLRYEFDVASLYAKTMLDIADSQRPNGLVPDIAPEYVVFKDGFVDSPEWGATAVFVPWQHYEWTGDVELLRRQYATMRRYVEYLHAKSHDNLLDHGLGDWYDLGPKPPGPAQLTPRGLTATAFFYDCTGVLAKTAKLLDRAEDAATYAHLSADIEKAFNAKYFDAALGSYGGRLSPPAADAKAPAADSRAPTHIPGSQTAQAIPLVMNLVPADQRPRVIEAMLADVKTHGLTAGDIGHRYLLRALADAGRSDVVFDLHSRSDRPGYGWMLEHGATALTEAWDARRDSSHNHFMLGHITEWFYRDLAGIGQAPDSVGFKKIVFRPNPVGDVTWAKAKYASVRGEIAIEWNREGKRLEVNVIVPAGSTAEVRWPGERRAEDVLDVPSGTHNFSIDFS